MNKKLLHAAVFALGGVFAVASAPAVAAEAKSLDELLKLVKTGQAKENRENAARIKRFQAERSRQAQAVEDAKDLVAQEEERSTELETTFEQNDRTINERRKILNDRLGTLKELFGHLTSYAGDLRATVTTSYTGVQFDGREDELTALIEKMAGAEQLPTIAEMEGFWYLFMQEIRETGRVVKFNTEVSSAAGEKESRTVVRIGVWNIVTDEGEYLRYLDGGLQVLARQPVDYMGWAADLVNSPEQINPVGIDPTGPSGGTFLAALINSPTIVERWHQGGTVGYIITAVGVIAVLIAIWRLIVLSLMSMKVSSQLKSTSANTNNPLGRVLKVHEDNPTMDPETLELKLSEAVLKEVPSIENSLNLLKIIAAVAPLLGLLGTVTGMIITFQAITIFGAGDPKAMAGGISGALVTTVLGLCVAIPTVILHTIVDGRAKKILHILDEQTTGLIAEHTEANEGK